jgi:SAM-dependent methyltransferase
MEIRGGPRRLDINEADAGPRWVDLDCREVAQPTDMPRLNSTGFKELAARYDADFTDTAVGRALRRIVWARLEQVFPSPRRILELGCGTGEDAVRLAQAGHDVVATDATPAMLDVAREKARRAGRRTGAARSALRRRLLELRRAQLRRRPAVAGVRPASTAAPRCAARLGADGPACALGMGLVPGPGRSAASLPPVSRGWRRVARPDDPLPDARAGGRAARASFRRDAHVSARSRPAANLRSGLAQPLAAHLRAAGQSRTATGPARTPARLLGRPLPARGASRRRGRR